MLFWLLSCSDYGIKEKMPSQDGDTGPNNPEIHVSPSSLELGAICSSTEANIQIENQGSADLSIQSLNIIDGAWTILSPSLPFILTPQSSLNIQALGGPGDGNLRIKSNDPINPSIDVPIRSEADTPPQVQITQPLNEMTVGSQDTFMAEVTDDIDDAPYLLVQWLSSVDGLFGSAPPDINGSVQAEWNGNHTAGDHQIGLSVTDSCDNTTLASIQVCHQTSYEVDSLDLSTWNVEGVAQWDTTNSWLQVTDTQPTVVGSAFQLTQSVSAEQVELDFRFYIGDGTGADGFAVVALDTQRMTSFLGSAGGCLGYGNGAGCEPILASLPGWVIEVDTYYNEDWDPTQEDHIAFMFDGHQDQIEVWAPLPEMEDTGWHNMTVSINAPRIRVEIDGTAYIDSDIYGYYSFPAYIGFTGATGGLTNNHLIDALTVTETACEEE